MRTQQQINLIYRHTHKDSRGITAGSKSVMYFGDNGTTVGAIASLPEHVLQDKLDYAQRKEIRVKRDKALMPIFKKFNITELITGSEQWRDTEKETISMILSASSEGNRNLNNLTPEMAQECIEIVKAANITYPNP